MLLNDFQPDFVCMQNEVIQHALPESMIRPRFYHVSMNLPGTCWQFRQLATPMIPLVYSNLQQQVEDGLASGDVSPVSNSCVIEPVRCTPRIDAAVKYFWHLIDLRRESIGYPGDDLTEVFSVD